MRARFGSVPAIVRPLVGSVVRRRIKKMLWQQGLLRHPSTMKSSSRRCATGARC
jgi:hypothetical protein